ncbi:tetratricopeptide repeat protein, partial [bacterium]
MKILLLSFSLLLFLNFQTRAEPLQGQARLDSLLSELPKAKGDTNEVNLLGDISFWYNSSNPDRGIEYGQKGLALAQKINWKKGEANCYNLLGQCYSTEKNDNPKALEYFFKALKLNETIDAKNNKAITLGNIGRVYFHQLKYSKALEYLQSALLIYEEIKNKSGISLTLGNIGTSYGSISNYPKSLEYLHKALVLNTEIGNKSEMAMNLTNLGRLYIEIKDFNKSLIYLKQAFKLCTEIGNKRGLTFVLFNFSYNYQKQAEQVELL